MGNSRQGQHQTVKAASSTNTASKQESAMLREEPQELLTNQALGRVLQAQRKLPQISSMPMDRIQRQSLHSSSGFRGLSQELARGGSQGLVVQPKLKLTKAGDRHEHQADRVAAQVVKRINTDPIRKAEPIDSKRIMPKAVAPTSAPTGTAVTPQFETTIQQQRGQGQAIPEDVREPLEEAFHADFRHVRIHTNEKSHQLSHSIQAIAFTTGTDIFFKQGAYQPRSRQGQELLAHELTHVVQQNSQKTAVQRKGAGQIQFSNEPFPEIATFVQDVTQEIQSFSDTWLNSPPSEIEIFPWFKLVKPSIKLEQTTDNCSLDIQGELKLNFGSDFGAIQPKGGFKINYQSQTKKWDYKSENVGVEVTVSEILQFKANNIQYDRASKALKIENADLTIPKLNDTAATVTDATIGQAGLDWKTATISATEISLGSYAKITNPIATIGGSTAKYNSSFTGGFNVNLGQPDLLQINGSGNLSVTYQDEKWGCTQKDVQLNGTIANILNFAASGIQYDYDNKEFSIATASVSIPKLNNATATVTETKINSDGLTWNKATLNAENIALGDYAKITKVEASVDGKSKPYTIAIAKLGITIPKLNNTAATVTDATIGQAGLDWKTASISATEISLGSYAKISNPTATIGGPKSGFNSSFKGAFSVDLGQPDLLHINGSGNLSVTYQDKKWGFTQENVKLEGTIANILKLNASGIAYNHDNKEFSIATASVSIPKLNNATAEVKKTKINEDGLDWDTVTVQIDDISLGDVLSIKQPAFTVEGKDSGYSTTASGGIGLHFGEYLNAEGSGKIKLDRSKGNGEGKILVEHANLTAKGGIKLPGESFPWPNIDINYPIVPGVEAGIGLSIKGGIGASLQGSIAKEASKDWNLGVNPEINGFLEVVLKAKIAAGSAYFAAIQAFVEGGCKANFSGGLQLNGSLKYDEETKKVDASQLTSKYYANADFKASISAGVQAQALYFFTKDLYRIRATCSLGAGRLEGNLEFDQDGKFHIGKPNFSGVIAGEFDKKSIKLEEKSYVLIASENADAILKEAAIKIAGSGEKRKDIINAVKAGFIRSLNDAKEKINEETAKSQKYIEKLAKTNMKLSRYHELIEIANHIEKMQGEENSENNDLEQKLKEEEAALNAQEATEAEIVDEVKVNKEASKDNNGIFSKAKKAVKKGIETVENTKQKIKKIIPEKLVKKYNELKKQSADRIQRERNAIRIKYTDFKEEKKKSFSSLKESFPKITDKVSGIKSEASDLKKKASAWKTRTKESIKDKTLVKLTELGIKDSQSFVNRIEKLTELQIKYSEKHEKHSTFLNSAIEAKGKAKIVLKNVEAAIANLQQLEDGTGMNKLTEMTEQEKVLKNVQEDLSKDEVKLDDDLMKQLAKIEMEEAEA